MTVIELVCFRKILRFRWGMNKLNFFYGIVLILVACCSFRCTLSLCWQCDYLHSVIGWRKKPNESRAIAFRRRSVNTQPIFFSVGDLWILSLFFFRRQFVNMPPILFSAQKFTSNNLTNIVLSLFLASYVSRIMWRTDHVTYGSCDMLQVNWTACPWTRLHQWGSSSVHRKRKYGSRHHATRSLACWNGRRIHFSNTNNSCTTRIHRPISELHGDLLIYQQIWNVIAIINEN